MGLLLSCCSLGNDQDEDIEKCQDILDLRNFMKHILEKVIIEEEELNAYIEDHIYIPTTFNIKDLNEKDIRKRIEYLGDLKIYIKKIVKILKVYKNAEISYMKKVLKDFLIQYYYNSDDSKKYIDWYNNFKIDVDNHIKNNKNKI